MTVRVSVNGRYTGRPTTGVERYAHELVARLPDVLDGSVRVLRPEAAVASGPRGHLWEQLVLPRLHRSSGAEVLFSPCNVGPVSVRNQLVVVHDVAPFRLPESFSRAYGAQVRLVQRQLARRCAVATVSEHPRRELAQVLGLDPAGITVVPPAVGAPFAPAPAPTAADPRSCVFVGGHDERKNLALLLDIWPSVHRASGLWLDVVGRSSSSTLRGETAHEVPGVRRHADLTDVELAELYRAARCVLSPSRYEGFGLPLLEGMACGTPFLATDTGAARELAVRPEEQLLPLEPDAWRVRLGQWATADLRPLRAASAAQARERTWERSARVLADRLVEVAQGVDARSRSQRSLFRSSTKDASDGSRTSAQ